MHAKKVLLCVEQQCETPGKILTICTPQINSSALHAIMRRCGHCKHLTPEYKKLGAAVQKDPLLKSRVVIGKVKPCPIPKCSSTWLCFSVHQIVQVHGCVLEGSLECLPCLSSHKCGISCDIRASPRLSLQCLCFKPIALVHVLAADVRLQAICDTCRLMLMHIDLWARGLECKASLP